MSLGDPRAEMRPSGQNKNGHQSAKPGSVRVGFSVRGVRGIFTALFFRTLIHLHHGRGRADRRRYRRLRHLPALGGAAWARRHERAHRDDL